MIARMHVDNYKCLKDFDIELGKFNVLIGPNDSGKTAFLQTVRIAGAGTVGSHTDMSVLSQKLGFNLGPDSIWHNDPVETLRIAVFDTGSKDDRLTPHLEVFCLAHANDWRTRYMVVPPSAVDAKNEEDGVWLSMTIGKVLYFRFDPAELRKPTQLTTKLFNMGPSGQGLAEFVGDILGYDRSLFSRFENDFYERFPQYRIHIEKGPVPNSGQVGHLLRFSLKGGGDLPADGVSDGAILVLAFLALTYLPKPPQILLVEEPENGVHHARLKEIVTMLREMSDTKNVQVILTTHSPFLLDLVEPDDVRVFTKDDKGEVHAKRLSEYPDVENMKKHFMTGEIWAMLSQTAGI